MKLICMTIATLVAISFLVTPCNSFNPIQQYIERDNPTQFGQIQQYIERGDNYTPTPGTGCPGTDGYYYQRSSHQCFKLIQRPNRISWSEARQVCVQDPGNLVMAHPTDPIGLRNHLVSEYGSLGAPQSYPYLNCFYDESQDAFVWQDDGTILPMNDSLWFQSPLFVRHSCLFLLTWDVRVKDGPITPYGQIKCDFGFDHVLCEKIIRWCNPEKGFWYQLSSGQCFKLFSRPNKIDWQEAQHVCRNESLEMAHPTDPIGLRHHIVYEYGPANGSHPNLHIETWLNCKYEEKPEEYVWQDDGTILPRNDSLWLDPPTIFNGGCLLLVAWENAIPNKPYLSRRCTTGYDHVLCELKL